MRETSRDAKAATAHRHEWASATVVDVSPAIYTLYCECGETRRVVEGSDAWVETMQDGTPDKAAGVD